MFRKLIKNIRKILVSNFSLLIIIFLFSILYLPFLGSIPHLDGNIDFVQSYHFFKGGFEEYFQNWVSVHPPLKVILSSLFFNLFGINSTSYTLLGYFLGLLAIFGFYFLTLKLFDYQSANMATLLLTTSPLFLASAIFSLRDFLLTCFLILSLYFYSTSNYLYYLFFSSFAFFSKETGLLLLLCVIFVEFISFLKDKKLLKFLIVLLGLLIPLLWWWFLKINQKSSWQDWIFSEYANRGTYYVIVKNLINLEIFNKYAYQHWLHLFFLNFNWVFWLILLIGGGILIITKIKNKSLAVFFKNFTQKQKTILVILLFCLGYFLTVLCLQTYTIPRYILPVLIFLYLFDGYILQFFMSIGNKFIKLFLKFGMIILIITSLFFSLDPVSLRIWGKMKIFGKRFYAINEHLAGNDGITYNFQYLFLVKERTRKILAAEKRRDSVISEDCYWIFPDPRNDFQTIKILKYNIDVKIPCREKSKVD